MSEPDISTLARRLAEQNNVDWRVLRGSGPHGKVVERDVLDFLAKVMAGEEAINPTPEPVPEGMEAWPDQDIQGFRTGLGEAATLGELRDELGNASRDYFDEPGDESAVVDERVVAGSSAVTFGGAEPHAYGGAATDFASGSTPVAGGDGGIDEDIFLFEDEAVLAEDAPAQSVDLVGADYADPRTPTLVDEDAVAPASDDLDELLVAGDDFDADETAGEVDTYATSSHDSRFGGVPTGYLSDDDDSDSQPGALGVSTSDEGFTDVKFTEEEQVAPAPTTSGADWGDEISFGADGGAAHEQGAAVPDLWGPEATAQTDDSDLWTGPSGTSIDAFTDTRSGDTGMEEEAAWPADSVGAFTDSLEADTAATGA